VTSRRHLLAAKWIGPARLIAPPTASVASPTAAGIIIDFPLALRTGAYGIAPGPDREPLVHRTGTDNIAKMTPTGTITGLAIPTASSDPFGITGRMNARP
jgi:hypothetical protein